MRPATPILNLSANLRPSSPPQTPTTASIPPYFLPKIRPRSSPGAGIGPGSFAPQVLPEAVSQPPHAASFGKTPMNQHHPVDLDELSPCSSGSSAAEQSEPEEEESTDDANQPDSPVSPTTRCPDAGEPTVYHTRISIESSFVIEELSDFDDDDMQGRDDILLPSAIEYAESERSKSRTRIAPDDPRMIHELQNLNCRSPDPPDPLSDPDPDSDTSELDEHEAALRRIRAENRRQRMSQSSIGTKRTMSERGSDGGDSDGRGERGFVGFEEAGSSARRLRRRVGDKRASLIFQDPPPRIDEVPEELSLEETETLARELPFYEYTSMEVDSPRSTSV